MNKLTISHLPSSWESRSTCLKKCLFLVEIISKIFGFLETHGIHLANEGLTFKYGYRNQPGIIEINTESGYVAVYFVQGYQFVRKQVPIKATY